MSREKLPRKYEIVYGYCYSIKEVQDRVNSCVGAPNLTSR